MKKAIEQPKPNAMELLKQTVWNDVMRHPGIRYDPITAMQLDQLVEIVMQAVTARVGQLKTSALVPAEELERVELLPEEERHKWMAGAYLAPGVEQIALHMMASGLVSIERREERRGLEISLRAWVIHPEAKRPGIDP